MNIYVNNTKVGNSFKTVKRKVRRFQKDLSSGSIIELRYKKSVVKYKIETTLKDSRKTKGNLNVRFILL
jgi:hypothetical protein